MIFKIGQRWISNTETQLGLGIITDLTHRQVSLNFPAAGEERIYSTDNAPLSRIVYKKGEEITTSNQKKIRLTAVEEEQGLYFYTGEDETGEELRIGEVLLDCFIKLNTPQQRLFSGLLDKLKTFKLRVDTLNHASRLQQSSIKGLIGARTNHLKHQVYIANEVAQRYAPRVLLADEVGLGKTIEAGMILHHQLCTGRTNRVLLVVPQNLIHQWLVEMIRRFNLFFSIIDDTRYESLYDYDDEEEFEPQTSQENPFDNEQLVLCSLEFLLDDVKAYNHALSSSWDLLIVDEAHHLHWSEEEQSPEYLCIEELAAQSKGLLLLTATPEQAGIASHFARLRLLDPSRFYDLAVFKKEEENYRVINKLVQELMNQSAEAPSEQLSMVLQDQLQDYLGQIKGSNVQQIIKDLLDRHGTGRVLFRNTRAAIQGFPKRHLHAYPLDLPELYASLPEFKGQRKLYPELLVNKEIWLEHDPRVNWLVTLTKDLHPQKILIICAKASTAIALDNFCKIKKGIPCTSFHEGMSIIERDRAAAYFAEEENGAQVLFCSEIGSEGRNFQFAHHLVLFDLPLNPDLLEQRIGRLDRIGQRHDIEIHVPYLLNTAQEKLFRWYHEGINVFDTSCSIGFSLYEQFENDLLPILDTVELPPQTLEALIETTKTRAIQINQALQEGRCRLLELNSCNATQAEALITAIEAEENCLELKNYMAQVFQEYGIDHEHHSDSTEILHPTEHMKTSHFPGLKEDGITVTYSRAKALMREDIEFLSWEHPMVSESMEMILDSELGNATIATLSIKSIPPGTVFLESFYTINCAAPKHLQLDRFLPCTPIRLFMDATGKNLTKILDYNQLNQMCDTVKRHLGYPIIQQIQHDLEWIMEQSKKIAEKELQNTVQHARCIMKKNLDQEITRLEELQKINPSIRDEEIAFYQKQRNDSEQLMQSATLKLQALRVVVNKI